MKRKWLIIPAMLLIALPSALAAAKLNVGDLAPPLKAAKWFKGGPVTQFDSNQVYVVEFWATCCVPCRKSIPHLTELAKQYAGKAKVLGFSIWDAEKTDHEKRLAKVGKFVEEMGDQMDYLIAADDNDGSMAKHWMEAAGEEGIPTAFVVGRDGRIAWVGNPWSGMDAALSNALAGTLDLKVTQAAAAERQKQREARAEERKLFTPINELQTAGKHAEALAALDKLVVEHPELAGKVGGLRYKLLLACDEPAAYAQARKLLEGEFKNNASGLYMIARDLTDPPGRKTKDANLALAVAQRACELRRYTDPSSLSTLAEAWFGKGDYAKAIETEEKAIQLGQPDAGFASSLKYLQRRLEVFKAAQQKASAQPAAK